MKLLYIANTLTGAGGLQRVLLLKAGYLAERMGYNVTVLTTNDKPDKEIFYPVSSLLKCITVSPAKPDKLSYFKSYAKLLNESIDIVDPDVVIMCDNGLKSFLLPFILKKKRKLVYERHITKFIENKAVATTPGKIIDKLKYRFMDYSAARFNKFVVVTQQGKSEWKTKNIDAIPNPLWFDTDKVGNLTTKKVIAVGRHAYEKGYDRMFTIWKQVINKYPDWILDIYGDYNQDYNIKQLALDSGLTRGINFLPPTKNIIEAYKNSSVCLMTSRYEGFGMVLLEAMACGVPCIAFNCPVGPAEIITNNEDGFLIEDGNTDAFTKSLITLIENEELRLQMGRNAKISSQAYNITTIMGQWDVLFKSL